MSKQILIVGGGVIGLCTGYYLAQRGHRVTIADQSDADRQGCSFGNAGLVVPSHFIPLAAPGMVSMALRMMLNARSPFYIRPRFDRDLFDWGWKFRKAANAKHVARSAPLLRDLHLASRRLYEELAQKPGNNFGLVRDGLLMLCKTQQGLDDETKLAAQANQLGISASILDKQQVAAMESGIVMDVAGAVYFPDDGHLNPNQLMAVLRRNLNEMGVSFLWSTRVTDWRIRGGRIESARAADGEEFAADEFVLCGGAWSPQVATGLGLKLPMQPGKGYSLTLPNPSFLPRTCAVLTEARVAVTPMGQNLRFAGTMEMSGLNHDIRLSRVEGIVRSIPAYYPQLRDHFKTVPAWCGLRPCSPDGLPYIGRTRCCANLSIATGHAMIGISLAPISGQLVAQLIDGEKPSIDIGLLHPDRYSNNHDA